MPSQGRWTAESTYVAGHIIPIRFTCPHTVTHPSSNCYRCRLVEQSHATYAPTTTPRLTQRCRSTATDYMRGGIPQSSAVIRNLVEILMFCAAIFRGGAPTFLTQFYKLLAPPNMCHNLVPDDRPSDLGD